MRILALSDQIVERFYNIEIKKNFHDFDLVLGCGDLPYTYLEFLVSMLNVPVLYVPGNHDPVFNPTDTKTFAEGCLYIDQKVLTVKGLTIAGLGGSIRYRPDGVNQYTPTEMHRRALKLMLPLLWHHLTHKKPIDILVTHSPPQGIHDDTDPAHQGLHALNLLIQRFQPRYHLHGHTFFYKQNLVPGHSKLGNTTIINVIPYHILDITPPLEQK